VSHHNVVRAITLTVAAAAAWDVSTGADQRSSAPARALTAADYAHAEKFMTWNTTPLVYRSNISPTWLADDRFWYRITTPTGNEAIIVNPATGEKQPCTLPACAASAADGGRGGAGRGRGGRGGGRGAVAVPSVMSPDGKHAVFIRDWNLWLRDSESGKETPLTTDGVKDFGYATDNAGWSKSDRPIVVWSPDSKKVATFQQDQRGVGEMYLVSTQVGHPQLQAWKYPLPGDETVAMLHRVIIDVDLAKVIPLKTPADQHRSTLCDNLACRGGEWQDLQWAADSSSIAYASTSRDHRKTVLRVADAATGAVRDVLEETVSTFFESGNGRVNWRYLPASNEVIWFSERDNWGQLYLYDLQSGNLKRQITSGEGNVTQLLQVDEKNRVALFQAVGREKGRDPYFVHLYRVSLDGGPATLLTPEDANHDISLSRSGRYFVDSYSKPDVPPATVLRDSNGALVLELERADITKLLAAGWKPPQRITVKARDGVTDLYGLMYKPTRLVPGRKYPIVNHIYPGPQTGSVGNRNFSVARGDAQALAELGFVVVEIDGMGTPWRSKKFHEAYYGDMGDNTLPDQVAGMKELARRYPWIDITRAGIYGHSGGGYAAAAAMFKYPDFFKVGIAESGNHDNRVYEDDWAEKWTGLLEHRGNGFTSYDSQANQNFAKDLKGKLLLAHGTMDNNVPPNNTLLVVDALIKANKDFDLLMIPNAAHGYGDAANYMTRRRWDYFVKNLLGMEPPKEYVLRPTN
jgi:dipeptidyl aminopeptidase/acylaminoacyl peptidase